MANGQESKFDKLVSAGLSGFFLAGFLGLLGLLFGGLVGYVLEALLGLSVTKSGALLGFVLGALGGLLQGLSEYF